MQIGVGIFVLGVFISLVLLAPLPSPIPDSVLRVSTDDAGLLWRALQIEVFNTNWRTTAHALVPQEQVDETRIALATAEMPTGGVVGFEILTLPASGKRKLTVNCAFSGLYRRIDQDHQAD